MRWDVGLQKNLSVRWAKYLKKLVSSTGKVLRGFRRLELTMSSVADTDNGVGGCYFGVVTEVTTQGLCCYLLLSVVTEATTQGPCCYLLLIPVTLMSAFDTVLHRADG
jgi:hypothetical protein